MYNLEKFPSNVKYSKKLLCYSQFRKLKYKNQKHPIKIKFKTCFYHYQNCTIHKYSDQELFALPLFEGILTGNAFVEMLKLFSFYCEKY